MKTQKLLKTITFGFGLVILTMSACKKDETTDTPQTDPPITLVCSDFGNDLVLKNNANASVDYIIDCKVNVTFKLEIEPGTVVRFTNGSGLYVKDSGELHAVGTKDSRIVMEGVNGIAGDWLGININSENNANIMEYVDILDAGSEKDGGSILLWADARLTLNNCKIENGEEYGIKIALWDVKFVNANNVITKCKKPVFTTFSEMSQFSTTNTYDGNTEDFIVVESRDAKNANVVIEDLGVPYHFVNSNTDRFTVADNAGLIINSGVTIYFDPNTHFYIDSYITIKGTASSPVQLLGKSAVSAYWQGISIHSNSPLNVIEYTDFKHAGSDEVHDNKIATISMWYDHFLTLSNSTFTDCGGTCAVNRGSSIGTNTPFKPVNCSATWKGCDKNL